MTTELFENEFVGKGINSLGSVSRKEDLKPRAGVNINPPPSDGRCNCCGKPLSELELFDGEGDSFLGIFDGELLVKRWRPMGVLTEKERKIEWEFFGSCETGEDEEKARLMLIERYGKEEGENLMLRIELAAQNSSSWECRDCVCLDNYEYLEKLYVEKLKANPDAQ